MIDKVDQDEWFNLYLYLGSCWVNKSRYEARYDTRYDTGYKVRNWQRSLDTKSSWIPKFTNQESWHKVGLKSRRLRTKITPKPVRITYWEISSSSTGSTRNQDQFVFVFVETNRPGFSVKVSSQITGNEVSFNFLSKIRRHWKTRLIGINNWPGSGSGSG